MAGLLTESILHSLTQHLGCPPWAGTKMNWAWPLLAKLLGEKPAKCLAWAPWGMRSV